MAQSMAKTLTGMGNCVEKYACASRDVEKSKLFAKTHGFSKAYGSYEELVQDKKVELIYIASPHSHHYEHIKLCLEHGKHVLCEKPFTVNASQAREVFSLAKEKKTPAHRSNLAPLSAIYQRTAENHCLRNYWRSNNRNGKSFLFN